MSGQLVDWHFAGGGVIVRASARADMDRVRYAIGVHMAGARRDVVAALLQPLALTQPFSHRTVQAWWAGHDG